MKTDPHDVVLASETLVGLIYEMHGNNQEAIMATFAAMAALIAARGGYSVERFCDWQRRVLPRGVELWERILEGEQWRH